MQVIKRSVEITDNLVKFCRCPMIREYPLGQACRLCSWDSGAPDWANWWMAQLFSTRFPETYKI